MSDGPKPRWRRILLKLSGEAFAGEVGYGIDGKVVQRIADDILSVKDDLGIEVAVVVGGGNIWRGLTGAEGGLDRAQADYMGMLATVINALALQDIVEQQGVQTRLQSAIRMPQVAEEVHPPQGHPATWRRAGSSSSPPEPGTRSSPVTPRLRYGRWRSAQTCC